MFELLVAIVIAVLVLGTGVSASASPASLIQLGLQLAVVCLVLGVFIAIAYHYHLRRGLLRAGVSPRDWLLRPTSHHHRLADSDALSVRRWFRLGVASATVAMIGCTLALIGLIRLLSGSGS